MSSPMAPSMKKIATPNMTRDRTDVAFQNRAPRFDCHRIGVSWRERPPPRHGAACCLALPARMGNSGAAAAGAYDFRSTHGPARVRPTKQEPAVAFDETLAARIRKLVASRPGAAKK